MGGGGKRRKFVMLLSFQTARDNVLIVAQEFLLSAPSLSLSPASSLAAMAMMESGPSSSHRDGSEVDVVSAKVPSRKPA